MAKLSLLAEMLDTEIAAALPALSELDISLVDLKNHVFGARIEALDDDRRLRLRELLESSGVEVYCLATSLGYENVSTVDEQAFRRHMAQGVENILQTVCTVRPRMVRLLACTHDDCRSTTDPNSILEKNAPWVYDAYRDATYQLVAAGLVVTIENEPDSVLSTPEGTRSFFARLELPPGAGFTWDVQNMWQSGTFPTVEVYERLKPIINYVHVKGGRTATGEPGSLCYRSPLEHASWPVEDIMRRVLVDGISPVICLNSSHGAIADGDTPVARVGMPGLARAEAVRDAAFLRERFAEIQ